MAADVAGTSTNQNGTGELGEGCSGIRHGAQDSKIVRRIQPALGAALAIVYQKAGHDLATTPGVATVMPGRTRPKSANANAIR